MIKKTLHRILRRRHFWRDAGFDELTELYISSMLRTFALSLLMVFVPFYLYQQGYSIAGIFVFYGLYFVGKASCDILASYFVARFGPKHSMIISCGLQIVSAVLLLTLPTYEWPSWLVAPVFGAAASFFFIAYHVEFSKIKHADHSGKEIGEMQIFEKVATIAGPLVGGIAGTVLGSQYIFVVACVVLFASLWPLFRTAEPVRTRQRLDFDIPFQKVKYDYLSYSGLGVENTLCINIWPLYVSLFALTGGVYAKLGALTAASVLVSILAAHTIGHLIDTRNATTVLRVAAVANTLIYGLRPLVHAIWPAFGVNAVNEAVTTAYRMPYLKGMYAAADDLPGHRIAYVGSMECIGSITKGTAWFFLAVLATVLEPRSVLLCGFALAALSSLLVTRERFAALRPKGAVAI